MLPQSTPHPHPLHIHTHRHFFVTPPKHKHRSFSCAHPLCLEGEDMQSVTIIKTKTATEYRAIGWIKMHPERHVFLSILLAHFPDTQTQANAFSFPFSFNSTCLFWSDVGPRHINTIEHLLMLRIWTLTM